jgi:hypothetical protein
MSVGFRHPGCNSFIKQMTVFMRANGLAAKAMDALSALGVTMNLKWSYGVLDWIAKAERSDICNALCQPDKSVVITHDNVDIMERVQEQRVDNKSRMVNSTSVVAYLVPHPSSDLQALRAQRLSGGQITAAEIMELELNLSRMIRN